MPDDLSTLARLAPAQPSNGGPRTNAPSREMEREFARKRSAAGDWFDETAAREACAYFPRRLRLTKDVWSGRPFELTPWQRDYIIRPLFGWKRANNTRRYRRLIFFVPRKNGKTELAAGLAPLMIVADATKGGEVYFLASSERQARIGFDKCSSMMQAADKVNGVERPLFPRVATFTDKIYWPRLDAVIKPLDGRGTGKHGLNASGLIADELHEWKTGDLYTFVHQSEAARRQPLEALISTAGLRGVNFGWEVWREAEAILEGHSRDNETLVVLYGADPDDDWTDEAVWRKANPSFGTILQEDYIRAEFNKAMSNPVLENSFRRYHLNQWTSTTRRWLDMREWDACPCTDWKNDADLIGKPCYGGLDLAQNRDFAALAWVFPPANPDGVWRRKYRLFLPEGRVAERAKTGIPIERWVAEGAVTTTPGNTIDYEFIIGRVLEDATKFKIEMLGCDGWDMISFQNSLLKQGYPADRIVKVGQGFQSMSPAMKAYDGLVSNGRLDHGRHPVLRWMAGNVMVVPDLRGNIKPCKERQSESIDGMAADITAQFTAMALREEPIMGVVF